MIEGWILALVIACFLLAMLVAHLYTRVESLELKVMELRNILIIGEFGDWKIDTEEGR